MLLKQKQLELPIIQGGMGIGVSLSRLAGNVAKCGAMGVISSVNCGYLKDEFKTNPKEANETAFREEIRKAKEISCGNGMVAVNIMVATNYYDEMVQIAVDEGVDAIISGAGIPMDLVKYTKGTETCAAPIVSSGKAARLMCRSWDRKYGVIPDFIVIEGSEAGGHLGFKREEIENNTAQSLEEILADVLTEIGPFEIKYKRKIPVFVAGGVFDGKQMAHFTDLGASGAQMATRFIATDECDVSDVFKKVIVDAGSDDVVIVKSPVGMPGRAVRTPLLEKIANGEKFLAKKCCNCLAVCPKGDKVPFCISDALIAAAKGDYENGLFFCGSNVGKINKIVKVKDLIDEIICDWERNK